MVEEYDKLLPKIKEKLSILNYKLTDSTDFGAVFINESNWKIVFSGERYVRPAFDLEIVKSNLCFSIWILMEVFKINKKPSLEEQLNFIIKYQKEIFVENPSYTEAYNKLNDIEV